MLARSAGGTRHGPTTSAIVFSPLELVERLVAVVSPPRANQIVYRGVLAGNATWRAVAALTTAAG